MQGAHIISNNQAEADLGGEASLWVLMSHEWLWEGCVMGSRMAWVLECPRRESCLWKLRDT